jgi:CheY-like chemotaxis protein
MLAIKNAAKGLEARIETCEAESSLQTRELLHEKKFDLIILDNDFKDDNKKGRLPGIALLQMARKNGPNIDTAVIFCSGEVYETLRPMVEKFNAVYLSKANYKLDEFTGMLGRMLRDSGS